MVTMKYGNYNFLIAMQNSIDLLIAYANKIAFGLSLKEHAVNQMMI